MADVKISQLPAATTPVAGTEVLPIVQGGTTSKVAISDLTAGRAVSMTSVTVAAGAVGTPSITTSGDTNTGIFFPAADTIAFVEGGAEAMRIDSSSNVGIGTSSPTSILNVKAASPIFRLETTGAVISSGVAYNSIRDSTGSDVFINGFAGLANCYQFGTIFTNGFIRFLTGNQVEAVRIDSSGNVGIGTSAPSASAILDAQSTTKGVRMPNMTTTQKNAIASPAAGLMVFDTTLSKLAVYSGTAWQTITSV
jgi:hypothetical protein